MTAIDVDDDRIIGAATQMFAELGFDGSSLGLIADAAGMDPAELRARVGSKSELYKAVMRRMHREEQAAVADAIAGFTPTKPAMTRLLDAYLDFYADNPQMVSLWLHRRMGDAIDITEIEEKYARPSFTFMADLLRHAVPEDLDVDYVLWTIPWLVSGFLSNGVMHSGPHGESHGEGMHLTPADVQDFRRYLHGLMDRILPLPPN
jgi:AcrR family transcriptional regulator